MPTRHKSFQTKCVETLLTIGLIALVGHLSVNFWGRYKVQNELLKMKTSLHTLKDTINQIGLAYNELHKELQELADVTEKGHLKDDILPESYGYTNKQQSEILAKKLLHDIQIHSMIHSGVLTEIPLTASNKFTQTALNETTSFNLETNKKDESVGEKGYHNKKVQYNVRSTPKDTKTTGIATKNSLKSIAANTDSVDSHNMYDKNKMHKHERKCHDKIYCTSKTDSDSDAYFYTRF